MSFARTGSQAGSVGTALAVGRLVISRMIPGSLHRPLSHSAFVEVTLMPLRLRESNFAAWDRERPPWPSVFAEGVKVIKSKGEWACAVFCGGICPHSLRPGFPHSHPGFLVVCLFVCLFACLLALLSCLLFVVCVVCLFVCPLSVVVVVDDEVLLIILLLLLVVVVVVGCRLLWLLWLLWLLMVLICF